MAEVRIDIIGWTKQRKLLIPDATIRLLADNSITYDGFFIERICFSPDEYVAVVTVTNPSGPIASVLTSGSVGDCVDIIIIENNEAQANAHAIKDALDLEVQTNVFRSKTIFEVEDYIDHISDFDTLKAVLKVIARSIKTLER